MNLSEFLQLSDKEKLFKVKILEAKHVDQIEKIIHCLPFESIIKIAMESKEVNRVCYLPIFQKKWEDYWRFYGPNPKELAAINQKPINEYYPIVTMSCFDLLKGIFVYQGYLKLVKKQKMTAELYSEAEKYLKLSAQYGCFLAINTLCKEGLSLLKEAKDESTVYVLSDRIIKYAEQAATLYWTAGYYLLANVYRELSLYTDILFKCPKRFSAQLFYRESLQALCIAEQLENISAAMIHNAYQGKSLSEASVGKFISWSYAKANLIKASTGLITQYDLDKAEHYAIEKLNILKKIYPIEKLHQSDDLSESKPSESKLSKLRI